MLELHGHISQQQPFSVNFSFVSQFYFRPMIHIHDEKRDFVRMEIECELSYGLADSGQQNIGRCKTLSAAGISFTANQSFEPGLAMRVSIQQSAAAPALTAFIEVVRCVKQRSGDYEIAAVIKSIKGN